MKKLLGISILAATLASTAAFAGPGDGRSAGAAEATTPAQLVLSQNADQGVQQGFAIAAYVVKQVAGENNQAKKILIGLNSTGGFDKATVVLAKALTANDKNTIQEALFMSARLGNEKIGGNQFAPTAGNGNTIAKITVIGNLQDSQPHTFAIVASQRNTVEVSEVALDKAAVQKLTSPSKGKVVVAAQAGNR